MKKFNTLYKRAATGTPQEWTISVDGNQYWTEAGRVGGVITKSEPTICFGKNAGRANSTTDEEQALAEATSKHQKKLDLGYVDSLDKIDDESPFFKPMLAHKFLDYKDRVSFPALASRKIDGMRMINTSNSITSRNGKDILSCPHIREALQPLFAKFPNAMVDGEIYAHDVSFEKIMSIVKKTKPTIGDLFESEENARLWVFDGFIDESDKAFEERFNEIKQAIKETVSIDKQHYFIFVENIKVNSFGRI
jgi:DNA ligase 1